MRVLAKQEALPPFVDKLRSSVEDEARDQSKYAQLAMEAVVALPPVLAVETQAVLNGISTQEATHKEMLQGILAAVERHRALEGV